METKRSVFETLNAVNCNEHTEEKNKLTYLSWAWAWQIVKSYYPESYFTVYESDGIPYFTDGRTCWVKVGVTIEGLELVEILPIMDFRNVSIPLDKVTSMDMNKSIQRCLTKACARHGLGLYIYASEDLPDGEKQAAPAPQPVQAPAPAPEAPQSIGYRAIPQDQYWNIIKAYANGIPAQDGRDYRTVWAEKTNANKTHLAKFDSDVENFKAANNG